MKTRIIFFLILLIPGLIYAQWVSDPAVNTKVGGDEAQITPMVVLNSTGETYISYFEDAGGYQWDVYLQKLDKQGNKMWGDDGMLISDHPTDSWVTRYDLQLDKDENVILANMDMRTGTKNAFAYKISPEGDFIWGLNGIAITNNEGFNPWPQFAVNHDNSIVFMCMYEPTDKTVPSELIMKRVDASGQDLWKDDVLIQNDSLDFYLPQILATSDDNILVSWLAKDTITPDTNLGNTSYCHVYAQKFDLDGNALWANPVQADSGDVMPWLNLYTVPFLEDDKNGGAFIMWQSFDFYEPAVRVNHIDANGILTWPGYGKPVSINPGIDHSGGFMYYLADVNKLAVFFTNHFIDGGLDNWAIAGQLFSDDGQYLWGETAKTIIPYMAANDSSLWIDELKGTSDNKLCFFYLKEFLNVSPPDTAVLAYQYASMVDLDGDFVWNEPVIPMATSFGEKGNASVSNGVLGQWVATWSDSRNDIWGYDTRIYAQNITIDGELGMPLAVSENPGLKQLPVNLWPNPMASSLNIELQTYGHTIINLYDMQGRKLCSIYDGNSPESLLHIQKDLSLLKNGLYLLHIESGNKAGWHKIIKSE